jgi:type II restriction/modification system DNA methylase subunit YeeA
LLSWYYSINFSNKSKLTVNISKTYLEKLPIKEIENKKNIISLVNKILLLNNEIQKIPENSEKWKTIKSEIERTDKKIDQEVYKLYGLTEEEIKIVEESVK